MLWDKQLKFPPPPTGVVAHTTLVGIGPNSGSARGFCTLEMTALPIGWLPKTMAPTMLMGRN